MKLFDRVVAVVDNFQRRHKVLAFSYAVIKKYGQDNAGYQAAIITYYGLLSLFPLLYVLTGLSQLLLKSHDALRTKIATSVTNYFPLIGNQLEHSIHDPKKTGLELLISLFITFYGAKGVASALQYAFNHLWNIPLVKRPGFLPATMRSLAIVTYGGLGFIASSILSGIAASAGHQLVFKVLATLVSTFFLIFSLILVFKLSIAGHKTAKDVLLGATVAAIGLQILQSLGTIILHHVLKNLTHYGIFGLFIGLAFWLYLQAQVVLYAQEINIVKARQLYPRSIIDPLSPEDKNELSRRAKASRVHRSERIDVDFNK